MIALHLDRNHSTTGRGVHPQLFHFARHLLLHLLRLLHHSLNIKSARKFHCANLASAFDKSIELSVASIVTGMGIECKAGIVAQALGSSDQILTPSLLLAS